MPCPSSLHSKIRAKAHRIPSPEGAAPGRVYTVPAYFDKAPSTVSAQTVPRAGVSSAARICLLGPTFDGTRINANLIQAEAQEHLLECTWLWGLGCKVHLPNGTSHFFALQFSHREEGKTHTQEDNNKNTTHCKVIT